MSARHAKIFRAGQRAGRCFQDFRAGQQSSNFREAPIFAPQKPTFNFQRPRSVLNLAPPSDLTARSFCDLSRTLATELSMSEWNAFGEEPGEHRSLSNVSQRQIRNRLILREIQIRLGIQLSFGPNGELLVNLNVFSVETAGAIMFCAPSVEPVIRRMGVYNWPPGQTASGAQAAVLAGRTKAMNIVNTGG